ncbi:MAG: ZIP family metal transporter [Flavobacteriales bacterium]|nr:ZIP family metal transporter [Flavobacteriales bacterium]
MFQNLQDWFIGQDAIFQAFLATLFTWGVTALGASLVFVMGDMKRKYFDGMLGFTGGVMLAASFWSLLAPSIEMSKELGLIPWLPPAIGFGLGALFLFTLDKLVPHLHINFNEDEKEGIKTDWHKSTLLVMAITLHNIPEGLAVGVAFGAIGAGFDGASISAAVVLTIGIGIQNFPEGTAVSLPLRRQGVSKLKSFWFGQLSGAVEPIAGVLGAIAVIYAQPILPYALSFAAGAMVYVVVEEVIPESQRDKYTDTSTLGLIGGFILMMILDVGLG